MNLKIKSAFLAELKCFLFLLIFSTSFAKATQQPESRVFDRANVEQLINEIDKPRNASILKVSYFLAQGRRPSVKNGVLPIEEGWQLLKSAAEKEPIASKRWFIYQEVIGYSALRLSFTPKKVGFTAYDELFAHSGKAPKVGATHYVQKAIAEFVNSIPVVFERLRINDDMQMPRTFIKAWEASFTIQSSLANVSGQKHTRVNWIAALDSSGVPQQMEDVLNKQLSDEKIPKTYDLLSVAGHVFRFKNPKRSKKLLLQAKQTLPAEKSIDIKEVNRLYDELIDMLASNREISQAQTYAQERVQNYNVGRAKLISLLSMSNQTPKINQLVDDISNAKLPSEEFNSVVATLDLISRDAESDVIVDKILAIKLTELLEKRLSSGTFHSTVDEIKVRLKLSSIYHSLGDNVKAQKSVDILPKAPTTIDESVWWNKLEAQKELYSQEKISNTNAAIDVLSSESSVK